MGTYTFSRLQSKLENEIVAETALIKGEPCMGLLKTLAFQLLETHIGLWCIKLERKIDKMSGKEWEENLDISERKRL